MLRLVLTSAFLWHLGFGVAQAQLSTDGASEADNPLTGSSASPAAEVQNGGLGVKILFVGKNPDGLNLTVSAQVVNVTKEPMRVALIGPPPSAVDDHGTTYDLVKASGIGSCTNLGASYVDYCMKNTSSHLPGNMFTQISAGQYVVIPVSLKAKSKMGGTVLSYSMNLAIHTGDGAVSDEKSRELKNVAVSFPLIPLDK